VYVKQNIFAGKACRQHANLHVILRMKFIAPALFAIVEVSARAAVLTLADIVCIYNKSRCLQGERVKGSTTPRCDTPQFGLRRAATDFLLPREHSGEHSGL
jgi:hypothetical protein